MSLAGHTAERRGAKLPSSAEEGRPRHQENVAQHPLKERTRWCWSRNHSLGQHHSVCAGYGGFAAFLDRAATPPQLRRGAFLSRGTAAALIVLATLLLLYTPAHAQCALCVTALENSPEGRAMAGSFNRGILFLLAAPYAIFGTIGVVVFRAYRKKKLDAQRDNPYIPKN